jgi:ubiquinone/menaquinone biosynthesis C-methylase UbiE
VGAVKNACAGPCGALYDIWIERERVARIVGTLIWSIDTRPMFASMRAAIANAPDESTILDVPCGGGVAFRALHPEQRLLYLAVDLDEAMLARARRRAATSELRQIEFVAADMRQLPFADASVDLCLSYSGLHMIPDPQEAVKEIGRCLRPGAELIGTTFVAEGSLRQRSIFSLSHWTGHVSPMGTAADLERWLVEAQLTDVEISPRRGFVLFRARMPLVA